MKKRKKKRMELPFAILKIFDVSMGMCEFQINERYQG